MTGGEHNSAVFQDGCIRKKAVVQEGDSSISFSSVFFLSFSECNRLRGRRRKGQGRSRKRRGILTLSPYLPLPFWCVPRRLGGWLATDLPCHWFVTVGFLRVLSEKGKDKTRCLSLFVCSNVSADSKTERNETFRTIWDLYMEHYR